jgi:MFS family permease
LPARRRVIIADAALPRTFWLLWIGSLINRLGSFVVVFLSLYLTKMRGLPIEVAGPIVSLYGAGSTVAGLTGGVMADRIGRRATMLVALFGGAAAMLALGFAEPVWLIALLTFTLALLSDLHRPAVAAMIADVVTPPLRQKAYGHLYWAVNLGWAAASVMAGFLARVDYRLLFILDAATTAIYGLIVWRAIPETRASSGEHGPGDLRAVMRDRTFVLFLVPAFLVAMAFFQHISTLPLDMTAHGHDERAYGLVVAVNGALIVLLQPMATRLLAGYARGRVLAASALLVGAGFGMYAVVGTVPLYALGVGLWTLGEIAMAPLNSAIVADLAPRHMRGRYQGVFATTWGLAYCLGPALGSWLMGRVSAKALWLACLLAGAIAALAYLRVGPRLARASAERRE